MMRSTGGNRKKQRRLSRQSTVKNERPRCGTLDYMVECRGPIAKRQSAPGSGISKGRGGAA